MSLNVSLNKLFDKSESQFRDAAALDIVYIQN